MAAGELNLCNVNALPLRSGDEIISDQYKSAIKFLPFNDSYVWAIADMIEDLRVAQLYIPGAPIRRR